jgi:hypothetical protein
VVECRTLAEFESFSVICTSRDDFEIDVPLGGGGALARERRTRLRQPESSRRAKLEKTGRHFTQAWDSRAAEQRDGPAPSSPYPSYPLPPRSRASVMNGRSDFRLGTTDVPPGREPIIKLELGMSQRQPSSFAEA